MQVGTGPEFSGFAFGACRNNALVVNGAGEQVFYVLKNSKVFALQTVRAKAEKWLK